jgi:hypothetical protein
MKAAPVCHVLQTAADERAHLPRRPEDPKNSSCVVYAERLSSSINPRPAARSGLASAGAEAEQAPDPGTAKPPSRVHSLQVRQERWADRDCGGAGRCRPRPVEQRVRHNPDLKSGARQPGTRPASGGCIRGDATQGSSATQIVPCLPGDRERGDGWIGAGRTEKHRHTQKCE